MSYMKDVGHQDKDAGFFGGIRPFLFLEKLDSADWESCSKARFSFSIFDQMVHRKLLLQLVQFGCRCWRSWSRLLRLMARPFGNPELIIWICFIRK